MMLKKPKFWDYKKISIISILLLPFSGIYIFLFWIFKFYKSFKARRKTNIPIICVGNIYLGGTGKTPVVREIFHIIKSFGKNPAFIKKYYTYLSDEIKMLENSGSVFSSNKRSGSISLAEANNYDVALVDDGFQDFSIKPNFSILCFNSKQMIGNGLIIPAGPLRESLRAIKRANCIIINGNKNLEFENKIFEITKNKNCNLFYSKYKIKNIDKFRNKKITAFAGIGNPLNFFELLKENKLDVIKTFAFADHHNYSKKDFEIINKEKTNTLVTTEKDFYRMTDEQKKNCDYVEVELEIENKEEFKKLIKNYL